MSDAAGTWWLDEAARRWSGAALAASGVEASLAPPLAEGSDATAGLRPAVADELGLPRGVVVAAGGGDAAVGAVGWARFVPATPSSRLARLASSSSLPTAIAPRRKNSCTASPMRCPADGIGWRRC